MWATGQGIHSSKMGKMHTSVEAENTGNEFKVEDRALRTGSIHKGSVLSRTEKSDRNYNLQWPLQKNCSSTMIAH